MEGKKLPQAGNGCHYQEKFHYQLLPEGKKVLSAGKKALLNTKSDFGKQIMLVEGNKSYWKAKSTSGRQKLPQAGKRSH